MHAESIKEITTAIPVLNNKFGKVTEDCLSMFSEEHGVWVHFSPFFTDPMNVPREQRAAILGPYANFPEEAIDEFCNDPYPDERRFRKAQEALMWEWNRIDLIKKKNFLKHSKKSVGLCSIFMGPGGVLMNLMMMFLAISEHFTTEQDHDEMGSLFILMLLMDMENKGPDNYQEEISRRLTNNRAYEHGLTMLSAFILAGMSVNDIQFAIERKLEQNQVLNLNKKLKN
jgi:hypothetical protein